MCVPKTHDCNLELLLNVMRGVYNCTNRKLLPENDRGKRENIETFNNVLILVVTTRQRWKIMRIAVHLGRGFISIVEYTDSL